ncbi:hypothetical protein QBZ16_004688, partial [Prototheca wickerhamii]
CLIRVKSASPGSEVMFRISANGQPEELNYVLLDEGASTGLDLWRTEYKTREFQETGVCSIVSTVEYIFKPKSRQQVETTEPRMAVVDVRNVAVQQYSVTKATVYVPISSTDLDKYMEVEQVFRADSPEAEALWKRFRAQGNTPPEKIVEGPDSPDLQRHLQHHRNPFRATCIPALFFK